MERVKHVLLLDEILQREVAKQATRLDRSHSWLWQKVWDLGADAREALADDAHALALLQRSSIYRHPLRKVAIAHWGSGDVEPPKGFAEQPIYMAPELASELETWCDRLDLTSWELLAYLWMRTRAAVAELEPAPPLPDDA